MNRRVSIVVPLTALATLLGCGDNSATGPAPLDTKSEVTAAHISRLADFLAERAAAFAASYAPGAIDLGGGETGTGTLPPEFFTETYWRDYMNSAAFDPFRGKSVSDVVDSTMTVALTKAEAEAIYGPNLGTTTPFILRDGDMYVATPPKPSSPLFDGWFAVYRKIDGVWRVVALD